MSSPSSAPVATSKVHNLTQRFNALSTGAPSTTEPMTKPRARVILTGEFRKPIRERLRSIQQQASAPVRPSTPMPSKRARRAAPQTPPPALPPMPECPGAPAPRRVYNLRLDLAGQDADDEDVLLDKKASSSDGLRRSLYSVSPESSSPLRQIWGPEDLAEINAKLQDWLDESADDDEETLVGEEESSSESETPETLVGDEESSSESETTEEKEAEK